MRLKKPSKKQRYLRLAQATIIIFTAMLFFYGADQASAQRGRPGGPRRPGRPPIAQQPGGLGGLGVTTVRPDSPEARRLPPDVRPGSRLIPRGAGIRIRGARQTPEGDQILDPNAVLLTPRGSADFVPVRGGRGRVRLGEELPAPLPPERLPRLTPRRRPGGAPAQLPEEILSLGAAPPTGDEPVALDAPVLGALQRDLPDLEEANQDPRTGVMRMRLGPGRGRLAGMPTDSFDATGLEPGTTRLADGSLEIIDEEGNGVIVRPAFDDPEQALGELAELGAEDMEIRDDGILRATFRSDGRRIRIAGRPQMNVEEPEEGEPTEGEAGISLAGEGTDLFATFGFSNGRRQGFTPSVANPPGLRRLIERILGGTAPQAFNAAGNVLVNIPPALNLPISGVLGFQPTFLVEEAPPDAEPGVEVVNEDTILVRYEDEDEEGEVVLIQQQFDILPEDEVDEMVADEAVAAELGIEEEIEEEVVTEEETPAETTTEETATEETPTEEPTATTEETGTTGEETATTEDTGATGEETATTEGTTTTGDETAATEETTTTTGETTGSEETTTTEPESTTETTATTT